MRLRTWLVLGYGAVLAMSALGLGLGLMTARQLAATSERMVERNFRGLDAASRLRTLASAQQLVLATRLGEGDASVAQLMPPFRREAEDVLAHARSLGLDAGPERDAIEHAERAVAALSRAVEAAAVPMAGARAASPGLTPEVVAAFESLRAATQDYYDYHHEGMVERGGRIERQALRLAIALALLAGFTVLVGVLASLHLAARLSAPMESLAEAAARVASGDFSVRMGRTGLREADLVSERFDDMAAALERFHAMNLDRILAESRRLDQVVATIDQGLIIFDEQGRIERINPAACALLGLSEAAVGKPLDAVTDLPVLAEAVAAALMQPAARAESLPRELHLGHGELRRTLAWTLQPFSAAARVGMILTLRDVTATHQFERMRTDFVLRASHELRTPITGMRMAFELLESRLDFAPDSREAELVITLRDELRRLVLLIHELLDLSRMYAGGIAIDRAPGNLADVVQRARQRFAPMAESAGLELALDLPETLPPMQIDVSALDRVFDNLIGNAIRHTPRGGRIALGARAQDGQVEAWVSDTGEGIAPADRGRVFEPFVQIGPRRGGAGMGLAMCRELVRQHAGDIELDSTPGRGATFTLRLPL